MDYGAIDLGKGGSAIPYCEEDKSIRREFEEALAREGVASRISTAEVSILEMPHLSEQEHESGIRAEILRLGQAIVSAAQSPQGIGCASIDLAAATSVP
jgi:hypothetical protein